MIYLAWTLNSFLALLMALMIRKLFSNKILKKISSAAFLSLFITSWFLHPGSRDMAPILSIYLMDILEFENLIQMRLVRPFLLVFFLILILDFLIFRYKSKN
jgi:hypothetical protein